jgi:hypothetical protein
MRFGGALDHGQARAQHAGQHVVTVRIVARVERNAAAAAAARATVPGLRR